MKENVEEDRGTRQVQFGREDVIRKLFRGRDGEKSVNASERGAQGEKGDRKGEDNLKKKKKRITDDSGRQLVRGN